MASAAVVIPAHDAQETLAACLDSVLSQSVAPAQIVLVDDASSDGTASVAARYAGRVEVVRGERRLFVAGARNAGLRAARAEIVFFLDADCRADPRWLAAGLAAFRDAAVGVRGRTVYDHPEPGPRDRVIETGPRSAYFNTCNIAYLREALSKLGGFDERFWCGREDTDLAFRALGVGDILYDADMLVFHQRRFWTARQIMDDAPRDQLEVLFVKTYLFSRNPGHNERQRRAIAAFRDDCAWGRVLYPRKLLAAVFPPVLLLRYPVRSAADAASLPLCWLRFVIKRLMYWYGALRYRCAVV